MPDYDYKCTNCNRVTTITMSIKNISDNHLCDVCNFLMKRVYSSSISVQFNGNGFYSTDK
jgi:putative FmdB family regulatory protein